MTTNFYPIRCNPCALCIASKEKLQSHVAKDEDIVDFKLQGNDMTLIVKEMSTTELKDQEVLMNDEVQRTVANTPDANKSFPIPEHVSNSGSAKATVNHEHHGAGDSRLFKFSSHKLKYTFPVNTYTHPENTYFEENRRNLEKEIYRKDLQEAERKRKLWKTFQKDIARERKRDLIKSSGPPWWQEPSRKQICLAVSLEAVIIADHEENVTGRTRQWLLDLGVTTRLTSKQVRGCMRRSLLDPVDFLLETHSVILKLQMNVKKKRGDLEKPFSINERLLLSAICVLHLPTLLIMLHYMLPPPKPFSSSKHINELLFGDLTDDRIRYDSPYMEPLPFRSGKHFHDWAFDKVFRALFPAIYKGFEKDFGVKRIQPKTMVLAKKSIMGVANEQMKKKHCTLKLSNYDNTSMTPSVTWLLTKCVTNRNFSPSMKPYDEEDSDRPRFYSRRLTKRFSTARESTTLPNISSIKETKNDITATLNDILVDIDNSPPNLKTETDKTIEVEGNAIKHSLQYSEISEINRAEASLNKIRHSEQSESLRPHHQKEVAYLESEEIVEEPEKTMSTPSDTVSVQTSLSAQETIQNFDEIPVPECQQLYDIWNEINDLPVIQQLKHATQILAEMGDPLAQLPELHKIPAVQRWFEIRQGKKRILSSKDKADLLRSSRGMWKMAPSGTTKEGPKIKCSKKTERQLTWDKKKWLEKQIKTEMNNYFSRVKQEKVDNSRSFFPSMLNHYDHGSKLNRNFRDVFFAYLPAREADTFVFRP